MFDFWNQETTIIEYDEGKDLKFLRVRFQQTHLGGMRKKSGEEL
jgi:hypothetical protein